MDGGIQILERILKREKMKDIKKIRDKNIIFLPFLLLLIFLGVSYPEKIGNYPHFIEWETIAALTGLLIITTSIKESGYFHAVAVRILEKMGNERKLALFLLFLSCTLSPFLTNDVALFIVVPLTIGIADMMKKDVGKMVIFEAMAVNVGSLLTPIGNPQNLFLWHEWGISFSKFVITMLPLFLLLLLLLIIFLITVFPPNKIDFYGKGSEVKYRKKMFISSIILLTAYIACLQFGKGYYALFFIFLIYLAFFREIFARIDWLLIILFVIMFIDFRLITEINTLHTFMNNFGMEKSSTTFILSLLTSQITSNVPASIFISQFSHQWFSISYGVNVGGNGFVIASLANIIALRFVGGRKIWLQFHKYSVPYFIITAIMAYLIFFR